MNTRFVLAISSGFAIIAVTVMPCRSSKTAAVLCGVAFLAVPLSPAQTPLSSPGETATLAAGSGRKKQDPAEIYLTAYRLCRESEKLATEHNYEAAIRKGRQAEKVLASIVRDFPQWKSSLVATRRKLLAENIAAYRKKAQEAPIPTGRQPGKPLATNMPNPEMPRPPRSAYNPETSSYKPIELPDYDSTDKDLYNALALAQEECRKMAVAYRELNTQFSEVRKQLVSAQLEQQMYRERYEKLQAQVASERNAGNKVVDSLTRQLTEMEAKYRASEQAREEAEARVAELENTLAQTQAELERVTKERDALREENEQLRAIVELNNPEKTKILLDQNLTLAEQLKNAQARVSALEARQAGSADEQEILSKQLEEARRETERLREEMGGLYDENMGYRRRVSELTAQLNNLEADLDAQANAPHLDPALEEENRLLRDVIAKQKRTLAMQEEGRKLLIDTYKQIKNNDPNTLRALQKLDEESSLELTDAERRVMDAVIAGNSAGSGNEEGAKAVRDSLEVEALANLAAKAFAKQRYTAAEQLYRTLYESQPDHVAGLVNLGTILLYRNKCEEAANYLTRAARLSPELAIGYYLAGICYYRMDRMEEAMRMFARTVELDPANAEAFFYLANIEGLKGLYEQALKHFAAAVKLKPSLGDAHYNMARLYAEMKKIPDAARAYDRAVHNGAELDPEFEEYLRKHPDRAKAPGADLVETVKPEEEAAELRRQDPELERIIRENREDVAPRQNSEETSDSSSEPDEREREEAAAKAFDAAVAKVAKPIDAAPTPSRAGQEHETSADRFSTVSVKRRTGRRHYNRIKLRLKKPAPQRLRSRGSDHIIELKEKERQ